MSPDVAERCHGTPLGGGPDAGAEAGHARRRRWSRWRPRRSRARRRAVRARRAARPCRTRTGRRRWRGSPRAPSRPSWASAPRPPGTARSPAQVRARRPAASRSTPWRRRRSSGPRARTAAASRNALSAPPLNATSRRPWVRSVSSRAALRVSSRCVVEPGGELGEVGEHHVGAGLLQLVAGAATGEHGDRGDACRLRTFDVVDVVADVDVRLVPPQDLTLARAPDPPLDDVDVEAEVVDVQLGVGRVLAGHQHDPPVLTAYGGQRLDGAGERRHRPHRQVGIDLAEPVGGRGDVRRRAGAAPAGARAADRAWWSSPRRGTRRPARPRGPRASPRTRPPCRSASCRGRTRPPAAHSPAQRTCAVRRVRPATSRERRRAGPPPGSEPAAAAG